MTELSVSPLRVAIDGGEEDGLLVLHDSVLVAVLVCLNASFYDSHRGHWHLEAGFGRCATRAQMFDTLEIALRWVAGRLELDAESVVPPAVAAFRARAEPR